jgi:hypothetical protein
MTILKVLTPSKKIRYKVNTSNLKAGKPSGELFLPHKVDALLYRASGEVL